MSLVLLHWLVVVLVIAQYITSFAITRTHQPHLLGWHPSPFDLLQHTIHNRVGLVIVVLMVLRFGLRLRLGTPAPVAETRSWQRTGATGVHFAFYGLLILQGITGAVATYLWWPISIVHQLLFKSIVALAAVHILAAAYHQIKGQSILKRILPMI